MRKGVLHGPAVQGAVLALTAAGLFGLSTPFLKWAGEGLGPFYTASLLYAGAMAVAWLSRRSATHEARLQWGDAGRLVAMALMGAVVGPVALAWGLQHTSGTSASLMLTLEALFTAVLAWLLYKESLDRRVQWAMLSLLVGGLLLVVDQGHLGQVQMSGLLAVGVATVAWGVDNALSRGVAERDPGQVVLVKAVLGATATAVIGLLMNERQPPWGQAAALLAIGASGYGLSLRFYLLAQRSFGASRTGSVFAFAPFIGALAAFAMGEREASLMLGLAAAFMLLGVWIHLHEQHAHEHTHEAMEHEHAHRHDDDHHLHHHDEMPSGPHSHWHRHEPIRHAHPHVPDLHHQHTHCAID